VTTLAAALHWADDQKNHAAAVQCWDTVMLDILKLRREPENAAVGNIKDQDIAAAKKADEAADLRDRDFDKARAWIIDAATGRAQVVNALKKLGVLTRNAG
jgi:hypothetical protein